ALAVLGDPRPGVGVIVGAQRAAPPLPGLNWVLIPGTAQVRDSGHAPRPGFNGFKLGDGFKPDPEYHEEDEAWPAGAPPIDIAPFYIAAYPVTVAQFRPFVEGDGYANPDYWTKAGWARCQGEGWRAPRYWNDPVWHLDNHPVVGVSWYEAAAYCHWLTARLRERDEEMKAFVVRLPAEAEWEWAARGPEARRWPWGDTWQAGRCNSAESGIGRTCAVGSFPTGANWVKNLPLSQREAWERGLGGEGKHAVHDLAGNVWEWCSTRWQAKYPLSVVESEWSDSYLEGTDPRALRGGAWNDLRNWARAASRLRHYPHVRNYNGGFRCCLATSSL
ncbi:MAG: formylglycine-generating enzyme family protein, partial [Anaerolineae bacterium]